MKKSRCNHVFEAPKWVADYQVTGMDINVVLHGCVQVRTCKICGETMDGFIALSNLVASVCKFRCFDPVKLRGREIKEIRSFLGKRQADLAEELGIDNTLLSKYETNARDIPDPEEKFLRILALVKAAGDCKQESLIPQFTNMVASMKLYKSKYRPVIHLEISEEQEFRIREEVMEG